jgi:hypothetical protein
VSAAYEDRWARHYQDAWEVRSGDPRLQGWLRVAAYAFGKHGANGHTPLTQGSRHGPGTLQVALATVDRETGEVRHPSRQRLHEWVRAAVDYGWLDPKSSTRCLIVPPSAIEGGLGSAQAPCRVCDAGKIARRRRPVAA